MVSDMFRSHFTGQGLAGPAATADGLRYALSVMVCVNLWSAFHYMRSARTIREDIAVQI